MEEPGAPSVGFAADTHLGKPKPTDDVKLPDAARAKALEFVEEVLPLSGKVVGLSLPCQRHKQKSRILKANAVACGEKIIIYLSLLSLLSMIKAPGGKTAGVSAEGGEDPWSFLLWVEEQLTGNMGEDERSSAQQHALRAVLRVGTGMREYRRSADEVRQRKLIARKFHHPDNVFLNLIDDRAEPLFFVVLALFRRL